MCVGLEGREKEINFIIFNINSYSLSLVQWENVFVIKTVIIKRKVNNGGDKIETEFTQNTDNKIKTLGSILSPWLHASPQLRVMAGIGNIWNINMTNHSRGPGFLFLGFFFWEPKLIFCTNFTFSYLRKELDSRLVFISICLSPIYQSTSKSFW